VGPDDFLILEKDRGTVMRVNRGAVADMPLLDEDVAKSIERGMGGIAVSKNGFKTYVFLYFTEIDGKDGSDREGKSTSRKSPLQKKFDIDNLITFDDNGKYDDPKLVWEKSAGLTSIVFLDSDKLGTRYKNDILLEMFTMVAFTTLN
jgi:hypothetical protein